MFHDNLLLSGDPTLPDLTPEDPIFDDLLRMNDWTTPIAPPDAIELGRKLDGLTITSNTQGLRIEIEKAKRQRLQASVRQARRDLAALNSEIIELRSEMKQMKETQNAVNYQLDGENARTNTLAFRSLARISEILTTLVTVVPLPSEPNLEVKILLQELSTTIQHFGVHYTAS